MALFREWSNQDNHSLWFRKYISYDIHLFSQNVWNLMWNPEMEQKLQKKVYVFQIILFEMGVENSDNLEQDTCRRQSIVNKNP